MAQLAFGLVFAAIGWEAFGTGFMMSLMWSVGSMLGSMLFPSGQTMQIEGPKMKSLQVTTSVFGVPINKIYGTARTSGNIIWANDLKETKHEENSGGGKGMGGGGGSSQIWYTYSVSFAVALCEGPVTAIRRVWLDSKLFYDATGKGKIGDNEDGTPSDDTSGTISAQPGVMTFYLGTPTQEVDPTIEAIEGAGKVSAFRDLVYIVFNNLQLADYGNHIPNVSVEVVQSEGVSNKGLLLPATTDHPNGSGMVVPGKGWMVGFGASTIWRYNLNTRKKEKETAFTGYGTFLATDGDGFVYTAITSTTTTMKIQKRSATSLSTVLTSPYIAGLSGDYPKTSKVGCWQRGDSSNAWVLILMDKSLVIECSDLTLRDDLSIRFTPSSSAKMCGCAFSASDDIGLGDWVPSKVNVEDYIWCDGNTIKNMQKPSNGSDPFNLDVSGALGGRCDILGSYHNFVAVGSYATNKVLVYSVSVTRHTDSDEGGNNETVSITVTPTLQKTITGVTAMPDAFNWKTSHPAVYSNTVTVIKGTKLTTISANGSAGVIDDEDLSKYIPNGVTGATYGYFDPISSLVILDCDQGPLAIPYNTVGPNSINLDTVVSNLLTCRQIGMSADDIDVTDLSSQIVRGYVVSSKSSARAAIEPLMNAYLFDVVETGGKLVFLRRGRATSGTISASDLGAVEITPGTQTGPTSSPVTSPGGTPETVSNTNIQEVRVPDSTLPKSLTVEFLDPARNLQSNTRTARRHNQTNHAAENQTVSIPLVLTVSEAQTLAEKMLKMMWSERSSIKFNAPISCLKYDPTDVVIITDGDVTHYVRISQIDFGANYLLAFQGIVQRDLSYDSTGKTSGNGSVGNSPPDRSPADLFILDLPMLSADQDQSIVLACFGSPSDSWPGGVVYQSSGDGDWFISGGAPKSVTYGRLMSTLSAPDTPWAWDDANSLTIELDHGDFFSEAEFDVLNGRNAIVVGNEIIQFCDAELQGDGTYVLSHLLRGRRGTEDQCAIHALGDRVILFDATAMCRIIMKHSAIQQEVNFIGPTIRSNILSAIPKTITYQARSLQCFSPVHIAGTRDGSGNLRIDWVRRARWGAEWNDGIDVGLFEEAESYQIDIINNGIVVRTLTATKPVTTYSGSYQVTDFGSLQGAVSVAIYQMNSIAGRGIPGLATV